MPQGEVGGEKAEPDEKKHDKSSHRPGQTPVSDDENGSSPVDPSVQRPRPRVAATE